MHEWESTVPNIFEIWKMFLPNVVCFLVKKTYARKASARMTHVLEMPVKSKVLKLEMFLLRITPKKGGRMLCVQYRTREKSRSYCTRFFLFSSSFVHELAIDSMFRLLP